MYVILSGTVQISQKKKHNDESLILEVLGPGQVLGEMSLISHEPRCATARALEDVTVKVITGKSLEQSLACIPPWSMSLAKVLVQRLKHLNTNLEELIFKDEVLAPVSPDSNAKDVISFKIESEEYSPHILYLKGHFSKQHILSLDKRLKELVEREFDKIIIDFSNIIDIDTDVIPFVVQEIARLKTAGVTVAIHNIHFIQEKVKESKSFQKAIEVIHPPSEEIAEGEYLIRQGDDDDCMFIIKKGHFKVLRTVQGKEIEFAEVGNGNVVGELGLIAGRKRMASVKAVTACSVYRIQAKAFHQNHFNIPKWFLTILKQLVERICNAGIRFDEVIMPDEQLPENAGSPGCEGAK